MPVAVLCDVHGNEPALEAVLAEVEAAGADRVVVGGDVVSGPMPGAVLDRLAALGGRVAWVLGNGDRDAVAAWDAGPAELAEGADPAQRAAAWAARGLSRAQRDLVASFAPTVTLTVEGLGAVCFCHGTPRSEDEIVTRRTPAARLERILTGVPEAVVVGGHTHQQFDRRAGRWRVVNAGSVGVPYEGRAAAFWALLGPHVELRETAYDIARAVARMRATGDPDVDDLLRESLLEPAEPDAVAELFEGLAESS
jgi:predicted phosphodiesterase